MPRIFGALVPIVLSLSACGAIQTAQVRHDIQDTGARLREAQTECKRRTDAPELDLIRGKVMLYSNPNIEPPAFAFLSNNTFATDAEKVVIAQWAAVRDECVREYDALMVVPTGANAAVSALLQETYSISRDISAQVGALVVALYQQKLTYGEFAQKRYEIGRDGMAATQAVRQAALDRNAREQSLAQQRFANSLASWAAYTQAVNARQPQTVFLNVNGTIRLQQ